MSENEDKLTREENRFFGQLADRELPEPSEASCERILSHAAARITPKTSRQLSTVRRSYYHQLVASVIAVSVVLILFGVCWYSMSEKIQKTQPNPQSQIANHSIPKIQPIESEPVVAKESLDPMAFDDHYGRVAVDSTRQKINSFWNNERSWQPSRTTSSVDQRLSAVRYRIEQLKKRSELDELFRSEPKMEEGGHFELLSPHRYVWFDTPWYLFDGDV